MRDIICTGKRGLRMADRFHCCLFIARPAATLWWAANGSATNIGTVSVWVSDNLMLQVWSAARSLIAPGVLVLFGCILAACQLIGPGAIGSGRDRYNGIIQTTSMQQTMSNIVRVYNHEPTFFMDVTEVDATSSIGGSLMGAATNIGAKAGTSGATIAGRVGAAQGTVQYSETPTIRYQPLLGQALVAQLVTPVSVDAIGLLYDSSWALAPLLDFSMAYLTFDYNEFYTALNTIIELDNKGGIELVAAKSGTYGSVAAKPNKPSPATSADKAAGNPSKENDALIIFLRPFHPRLNADVSEQGQEARVQAARQRRVHLKTRELQLWIRLLRIYMNFQSDITQSDSGMCRQLGLTLDQAKRASELRDWDVNINTKLPIDVIQADKLLNAARGCVPDSIDLRVMPSPNASSRSSDDSQSRDRNGHSAADPAIATRAPMIRTYSALGVLKNAIERPRPKIEFVTPEMYQAIRGDPWNQDLDSLTAYTLLPSQEDSIDCKPRRSGCDNPATGDADEQQSYNAMTAALGEWIKNKDTAPGTTEQPSPKNNDYLSDLDVYETKGGDALDDTEVQSNRRLGLLRRYILVVVDNHLPLEPVYVSYSDGVRWYYIANGDSVSEKNFHLLSLFLTMMATPPSTQPLSPVINVGG